MRTTPLIVPIFGWLALALPSLPAAETTAAAAKKEEPLVLSIFQVREDMDEGYRSSQTISGSRTLAELRDTRIPSPSSTGNCSTT